MRTPPPPTTRRAPDWSPILCPGVSVVRKLHELAAAVARVATLDLEVRQWVDDVEAYRASNRNQTRSSGRRINGDALRFVELGADSIKPKGTQRKCKRNRKPKRSSASSANRQPITRRARSQSTGRALRALAA